MIIAILQNSLCQLIAGSDSCTACNEQDVRDGVCFPLRSFERGEEEKGLAGRERMNVCTRFALGISLDQKFYNPWCICVDEISPVFAIDCN